MRVAVDIDGTINAAPGEFLALMTALKASGVMVTVLTGSADDPVTQKDFDEKVQFLTGLGCGECWYDMTVLGATGDDLSAAKAKWCDENSVDVLIDNNKDNAKAAVAAGVKLVLVPWATRE